MTSGVIDGRFEIEELAGTGGMGEVYRARDAQTGARVAVKLLLSTGGQELSRFSREAQALAALRLPGVVQYIAHGVTEHGKPYLAMEWLEGETLSKHLERGRLSIAACVSLGSRVATTLGAVHRLGLVHRDLKPSNLLLADGDVKRVMLIDFGIVRVSGIEQQLTKAGSILGTPGYMAPEQARGQLQLDARADVFSLGCVLFKCLTGRAAFEGSGLGLLAKVLLDEPPPVRSLRPEVPERLEALITRMLSKSPENRPRDGTAVAALLAGVELPRDAPDAAPSPADSAQPTVAELATGITTGERRLMCLVLAKVDANRDEPTRSLSDERAREDELATLAKRFGAELNLLDGRSPLLVLSGVDVATDLAARAAHCALALGPMLGGAPVALVTGRSERHGQLPVAELIDRAVQLLPLERGSARRTAVRVDDVTVGLLGSRFEVLRDGEGAWLQQPLEELHITLDLLGRPTPCVGRDRELSLLTTELDHCIAESAAGAVLVLGQAGLGKSRLRHEFVSRVRGRDEPVELWFGKADPMSAGATFGLIAQALRRAMGLLDDEPIEARRRKVLARVARHEERGVDVPRVAAFLGEIVGAPFADEHDGRLQAARRNPVLMGDQIREAWEDFLGAECAVKPVVLVLEDLHWGDLPTTKLVDAALRHVKHLAFFVLALGRSEVGALFPRLWEGHSVQQIHLTPLPRRACERLVQQVLGKRADAALVAQLVARADGNPFFLEEQIRAVAEGKGDRLPETVLAVVQGRLETLDNDARRVLRAASVFGERFVQEGVAALLGGAPVTPWLDELSRREVVVRRHGAGSGRSAQSVADVEYAFRHSLVREAAYGMLTERDRIRGHRLAGEWLEQVGTAEPLALAEHFERGGVPPRAARAYLRAAEQALQGNDFSSALSHAERGVACSPEEALVGALRRVQAEAYIWRGDLALAEERSDEAVARLERGSAGWFSASQLRQAAAAKLGGLDRVERWLDEIRGVAPAEDAVTAKATCLVDGATSLIFGGRYAPADALLDGIERSMSDPAVRAPEVVAKLHQARAFRVSPASEPEAALAGFQAALAAFEEAGDRRNACMAQMNLGFCYAELGDFASAEEVLTSTLSHAERMQLHDVAAYGHHNLGMVLAQRGKIGEGRALEEAAAAAARTMGDPRLEGGARTYLARIALLAGDLASAEREVQSSLQVLESAPPLRVVAAAIHARVLLRLGRSEEALVAAREAHAELTSLGTIDEGESLVRLVHAEALAASGHQEEAAAAIASARDSLMARADKLRDPAHRERFLQGIPDNARTLALAQAFSNGSTQR